MARKVAFIGSGSNVFSRWLVRDLLVFPEVEDAEIWLMDVTMSGWHTR